METKSKLTDSVIRNETSFPEIFNMTESEVLRIMDAQADYENSKMSYSDWCLMYQGVHHEARYEKAQRDWLACTRWHNQQTADLTERLAITEANLSREKKMFERVLGEKASIAIDALNRIDDMLYTLDENTIGIRDVITEALAQLTPKENNDQK